LADDFQYDVFLSHNAKVKARVRRLAERSRAAGGSASITPKQTHQ